MSTPGNILDLDMLLMEASSPATSLEPHYVPHFAPWAILLSGVAAVIMATVGFFGNLLTILALPYTRRLRNAATWFVINLAASECLFCATILPMCAAHLFHLYLTQEPLFSTEGCRAFVFLRYVNIYVELFSIAAIAVNRCVLIANPRLYQRIYTDAKTIVIIAVIWIVPIILMMMPLTGVYGKFTYNSLNKECDFADQPSRTPRRIFLLLGLLLPCVIIISSYSYILIKARKSSARMASIKSNKKGSSINYQQESSSQQQTQQQQNRPNKGFSKRDIRIARTIGVIFIVFLVCCSPVSFLHFWDKEVKYPTLLLLLHPLYWLQYCLNIFIYVFMNKQYRDAYINYIASYWPDFKEISIKKFQWNEEVSEYQSTRKASQSTIGQVISKLTTRRASKVPDSPLAHRDEKL